jgi:hypothetical protein
MTTPSPATALYTTTKLPALAPGVIRISFNNTNALPTKYDALLAAKLRSYLKQSQQSWGSWK